MAKLLFPVTRQDWYRLKGYGKNGVEPFDDFLKQQYSNSKAIYHQEFTDLDIKRNFVNSYDCRGNKNKLDSISFRPLASNKESGGIHIINFFGRGEYYEMNFRDMAREAKATGATVHAFNPPGMNCSSGHVLELKDLINAGIAQINELLKQGIHPDKIILQGNCMGAAIAEEVNKHFEKTVAIRFRRINSNSFKSMSSLLTNLYPALGTIKANLKKLLEFSGWFTKPGADFLDTDPYKIYMNRQNDQTIKPKAQIHSKVVKERLKKTGTDDPSVSFDKEYEIHRKWLDEHASMELDKEAYPDDIKIDAHELDLYKLKSVKSKERCTAYDYINRYIQASNCYIAKHPQTWEFGGLVPYQNENQRFTGFYSKEQITEIEEMVSEFENMLSQRDKDLLEVKI